MKTNSFSPASVTPDASWVGFSPVSALVGVPFAASGVDGHANASAPDSHGKVRGRISDQARRESRYQARPDCKTPGNREKVGRKVTVADVTHRVCVTVGRDRQILSTWRNETPGCATASTRNLRRSSMMQVSNPAALTTCHPKRSWLCRVAAGFIHALGGRDIASLTRLAKPTAMGNGRLAIGYAPPLQFILFAFASVAMGDPGHGTDLNRMNHANALFSALSQVESGDNDRAIGPKGEVTRYQILPVVWKRFGGGSNAVEPVSALRVAELVMRPRVNSFIKTQGRPPSAQEWYLLWHCPARVMAQRKSDTEKAERFANLVK